LDTTFNGTGVVTTSIDSDSTAFSVAVQPDGKIVAAGQSFSQGRGNFAVARYESDGDLDLTFKGTGIVTTAISSTFDFNPYLAIQPDGKIVLAGTSGMGDKAAFAVVRYEHDGDLDPTFNATGLVTTAITPGADVGRSIALQPDGKIVVAGESSKGSFISDFAVARYDSGGNLDPSFNGSGVVTTSIGNSASGRSVAIQPNGKIVVAGFTERDFGDYDFAVTRYEPDGDLDLTLNGTGIVTTSLSSEQDKALSVALQSDGKIVATGLNGGSFGTQFAVVRYEPDGDLDPTFNGTGIVTTSISSGDASTAVAIQPNGKIVVIGESFDANTGLNFTVVRYERDGQLDTTFNQTGIVTTPMSTGSDTALSVALQPDGKIVVAGDSLDSNFNFTVARFLGDHFLFLPIILK
jgi:uncharacterized delta-60 repeat protein